MPIYALTIKKYYNNRVKNKDITLLSMFIAITVVLGVVPNIGIIQIGPISLTILHIPVILASFMLGIKGGIVTGFCFGLTSGFICSRIKDKNSLFTGLSGFACTIIHSALVYIALFLFGAKQLNVEFTALGFLKYIITAISINSLIEAIVAGFICAILIKSIKRIKRK